VFLNYKSEHFWVSLHNHAASKKRRLLSSASIKSPFSSIISEGFGCSANSNKSSDILATRGNNAGSLSFFL